MDMNKHRKSKKATGLLNEEGVDLEMFAEMTFGDNKVAKIKSSGLMVDRTKSIYYNKLFIIKSKFIYLKISK